MSKNRSSNDDNSISSIIFKVGGLVLSGGVAVISGVIQGVGDVLGKVTDL